ncbi:putative 1-phosphatidylinositol-3-phosphate 5-kinase chromatin regulator PHD family [Helianthus annuus]|nr:putative 1-phosphatidylinositol-3-phosphate 5-kinase chromatin regulator PHD family [Helianthus annuus]KAJ0698099.1 putative 1-phosphatidylinositol-3-phosphate 5-kinase chromatin regulator PHD family [Helianthus annuus]KAJ0701466.1 putative 1-phosphatidylinositol-3-phosphate 5-kinase chromatin regulator PHD family [Helianthus annuus]KAJ0881165.1 putative 1-phosphatidylinositol-3-phosphate 5-kinase chromatin regulator PHD family [Helianthus annuus]
MDSPDKLSNLIGNLKNWIPRRSEANVSRDFWMPDQSCRVCYECDSQFTLFNRRHHCRLCGRVFCAKCTHNWIPARPSNHIIINEETEKIRACNYCFKQWQQGRLVASAVADHGVQDPNQYLSTSPSAASLVSTKSSCTADSSSITFASVPQSICSYNQSAVMEANMDEQNELASRSNELLFDVAAQSPTHYGYVNRGEDEFDEEFAYRLASGGRHMLPMDDGYYDELQMDDTDNDYESCKAVDTKSASSCSLQASFDASQQLEKKEDANDVSDECEGSSAMYANDVVQDVPEPVDFENNGVLWLPPEPEDEEDEREALLFDDDDDGDDGDDAAGEWGYLRSSSNFGSGECRHRDRSNEEHKKAMKTVVDGHFRALVSQLLQVDNLVDNEEEYDKDSWLEIITSLSWEAASLLKPDTSKGGGMDPGGYVKIKCLASGSRSDSIVVKGVVCKKNVAHRRMTSKIEKPRFLILGGALEYQRVSNHLSSFDTLLQQEMDHLKMAVAKIDAHQPDVLLVEKSVSRYAQEYLLAKDISLVLNIKRPLLERIARCTGAQIVPSIDHLSSQKLGCCDMFHVQRFQEEHGTAGQGGKKLVKTLMYFEGCPKPFGCTILLRGASGDELKKVKHVVQYGVFAAYHLALETSFLADEGASLPELPLNAALTVALPDKPSNIDRSISTIPGFTTPTNEKPQTTETQSVSMSEMFSIISNKPEIGPIGPNDPKASPYLHSVASLKLNIPEGTCGDLNSLKTPRDLGTIVTNGFEPSVDRTTSDGAFLQLDGKNGKEEFPPSPSDNQSILVSLSSRCVWKGTVCERSHLFRIKYYGNFDKPLGRFLRDDLFDQGYRCRSCEMPSEAHVQCYTHRQGTLTISVKKLPEILLPGEKEGKIWMWHRCLRCPRTSGFPPTTRRIVMSDAAWGLSFGKFLELSFSNHAAASRVASCGHSLHRDCLRFYGFGKMVACFRYASIDVHSVYLPPHKLDFKYENQLWIQHEVDEVVHRSELLFSEICTALSQMAEKREVKVPQSRRQIADLEAVLRNEKTEFKGSLQKILNREVKKGQPMIDILEINRLRRQLLFQSYMWDHRLVYASSVDTDNPQLDPNYPGSEHGDKLNETVPDSKSVADSCKVSDVGENETSVVSSPVEAHEWSDPLISNVSVRRAISEGQFPVLTSLSDTLEAAWTGNHPNSSGLSDLDLNVPDKLEKGDRIEESKTSSALSPVLSTKGSETMEDSTGWLGVPFLNFYRSLNKNFSTTAQKLDTLNGYNPVYISSFRESELQGGARLLLAVGLNDTVIPVYDDEPTSIISYTLLTRDYISQVSEFDAGESSTLQSSNFDGMSLESFKSFADDGILSMSGPRTALMSDPSSQTKLLHSRVEFTDDSPSGKMKYTVTVYYAKRFEALRRICCPSEMDYIRSLSRCKKWGAQGGKSNVFFAKTLDDRFIIKQVTKTELESFIKFAPAYFKYLSESIGTGSPTCLAKILGIYQVVIKHMKGGKETKMDVLIMENLLYGRNLSRLYDLKGSSRSRYNSDSTGSNKVLLDQNLIEAMPTSPIFVGNKAKRLLERAVWNDTAFLASVDVMDYSLLVGVDEEKHELVLGIIDFMRQYTWDKHLETWVKASGILGGPKNASPTVISPKQYKKRFRKAMTTYFLMVPDQWSPPTVIRSKSQTDLSEDYCQIGTSAAAD